MNRILLALASAIGLTVAVAASAFAWQSRVEGRPASFDAGGAAGAYFWRNAPDGFSLRTTDPAGVQHVYTGTVSTDGTIVSVSTVKLDGSDSISVDGSGHTLSFAFRTYSGIDGVDYEIQGGTGQIVDVQMDAVELATNAAFLGAGGVHPEFMPFKVCRTNGFSCTP